MISLCFLRREERKREKSEEGGGRAGVGGLKTDHHHMVLSCPKKATAVFEATPCQNAEASFRSDNGLFSPRRCGVYRLSM